VLKYKPDPLASNINDSLARDVELLALNSMGLFCTKVMILTHENIDR
jgi:hypothetical protein